MKRAAALLAALLAAACATSTTDKPVPAVEASAPVRSGGRTNADELVAYLARIRTMSEPALATEAARQRRESGDVARVKAALALSLAQAEEAEVLALVDPVVRRENGERDVKAMASFLQLLAQDRRRLKESAATAGNRLREERRAAEAQKQRADALQQKLDALTELEKSLSERPAPSR